ncbi:putative L-type lectin-domain containing receptor kinase S.7 [Salvia divinorum]|uniref:non-specific serine/threonine protein kinase n=1 Tax=Salvia divinorum TaxID=28513 RepID=A0ABD1I4U8_SALDI
MNSRNLLGSLITFLILCNCNASQNVNLEFPYFTLRNLSLLGDSYIRNGVVGLTRELQVPSSSSGSVIFNDPIALFDPETNIIASFSTRFSFSIHNLNPASFGDGLTFFLSPNNQTSGSPGGYLGLVNSSQLTKNRFVAVEFDTKLDLHFDDPDDNHIGLDIDSLISIETANPLTWAIDLKSGNVITSWIDYTSDSKKLEVFLSYSSFKPQQPLLSVDIDLSEYLKELTFVGFSASTEGSTELHFIESWSFKTTGFRPSKPRFNPHNVSDNTVPLNSPLPVSDSGHRNHKRVGLALGIGCPAFFSAILAVFMWFSVAKWRRIKAENDLKPEVMGPRQFGYKELKSATRGFHQSRILGHGAFGTVYKAYFVESGAVSAVKRSKHSHEARLMDHDKSPVSTLTAGTMGYLAPEYLQYGKATEKTDVYSYGVVILELACGRRPIEREEEGQRMVNLVDWVWKLYKEGRIAAAADGRMNGEFEEAEVRKLLLVGLSCANPDGGERPTMRRVLQILNNEAEPVVVPKTKPSLSFSNSIPLSIDEIVSDCGSPGSSHVEIIVD